MCPRATVSGLDSHGKGKLLPWNWGSYLVPVDPEEAVGSPPHARVVVSLLQPEYMIGPSHETQTLRDSLVL